MRDLVLGRVRRSFITVKVTAGRSGWRAYLLRCGHEVDGGVVAVVLLRQAEGELVIDEERVCWWRGRRRRVQSLSGGLEAHVSPFHSSSSVFLIQRWRGGESWEQPSIF